MLGNINAANLQPALWAGRELHRAAACRSTSSAARARSPRQMLDYVGFIQNDSSEQKLWDATANVSGSLFDLPGGPLGLALGRRASRPEGPVRPRSGRRRGPRLGHSGAADQGRLQCRRGLCRIERAVARRPAFFQLLELTGAVRFSDYSSIGFDDDVQGAGSTGSRSRTCVSAAPGRRASGRRRSANCSERRRASTRRSSIPARPHERRTSDNGAVRANCIAQGVPADGAMSRSIRRFR